MAAVPARIRLLAVALCGAAMACAGAGSSGGSGDVDGAPAGSGPPDAAGAAGVAGTTADAGGAVEKPSVGEAPPEAGIEAPAGPHTCATYALCDDFEAVPAGGKPDPAKWTVGAPNGTGTGVLAIDDAQHHSGARSVKVTGAGGYSNHIFFTNAVAIASVGPVVWARFYVRLSDPLGDGHLTFLAMKDAADGGKYLRMGGQAKILMWNRESDDATAPALSPMGIAMSRVLPTSQWLCVELMVDGAQGRMQTWIDGAEIAGLHVDQTSTPEVDEQWLRKANWRPQLTDFGLGWESYAGQAMTLWFDDVALDGARIGCL